MKNGKGNGKANGHHKPAPLNPFPVPNYARSYEYGETVSLPGGHPTDAMKKEPEKWALYYLPEGCSPRFHVIGEDSDYYALRNLIACTEGSKGGVWSVMMQTWKRIKPINREGVRAAYLQLEREGRFGNFNESNK